MHYNHVVIAEPGSLSTLDDNGLSEASFDSEAGRWTCRCGDEWHWRYPQDTGERRCPRCGDAFVLPPPQTEVDRALREGDVETLLAAQVVADRPSYQPGRRRSGRARQFDAIVDELRSLTPKP